MYTLDSAIATVIVIAVIAYAAWATMKLDEQAKRIEDLRALIEYAKRDAEEGNDD
mgnify:CR=1 FL=1